MKKLLHLSAVFVFLVLFAGQTMAAPIGQVTAVMPGAYAVRGGQDVPLAVQSPIETKDTLRTDASGKVQILFADNSSVTLGNNTTMEMQEFAIGEGEPVFKAHLGQGIMRAITGAVVEQNPKGFEITTPEATIGIRGTIITGMTKNGFSTVWVENTLKQVFVNDTEVPSNHKITVPSTPKLVQIITPEDIEFITRETSILAPRALQGRIVVANNATPPPGGLAAIPLIPQTAGDALSGSAPPPPPITTAVISGTLLFSSGWVATNGTFSFDMNLSNGNISNGSMAASGGGNSFSVSGGSGSMAGSGAFSVTGFSGTAYSGGIPFPIATSNNTSISGSASPPFPPPLGAPVSGLYMVSDNPVPGAAGVISSGTISGTRTH